MLPHVSYHAFGDVSLHFHHPVAFSGRSSKSQAQNSCFEILIHFYDIKAYLTNPDEPPYKGSDYPSVQIHICIKDIFCFVPQLPVAIYAALRVCFVTINCSSDLHA